MHVNADRRVWWFGGLRLRQITAEFSGKQLNDRLHEHLMVFTRNFMHVQAAQG